MVELYRLGRDLDNSPCELPDAYVKYLSYYAMARALERPGDGQNLERAEHYQQRFDVGVSRMTRKRESMSHEYRGQLGGGGGPMVPFGTGDPQVPDLNNWEMEL
jgi:hypothetical protein